MELADVAHDGQLQRYGCSRPLIFEFAPIGLSIAITGILLPNNNRAEIYP